ncbi:MAG: hypothetical protein ACSHX7_09975 [Luteolibacter sp.]
MILNYVVTGRLKFKMIRKLGFLYLIIIVMVLYHPVELSAEPSADISPSLQHGGFQLQKMIRDRPLMSQFLNRGNRRVPINVEDAPFTWVKNEYSRLYDGGKVFWDSSESAKPLQYLAEHRIPKNGENGFIRIRESFLDRRKIVRDASFEELWGACVYELLNIKNHDKYVELLARLKRHELTKDQWVRAGTKIEHKTLLELGVFHEKIWLPWALKANFGSDPKIWRRDILEDYDEWIKRYRTNKKSNVYQYWEDYYDKYEVKFNSSPR